MPETAWFLGNYGYSVALSGGLLPDGSTNTLPEAFTFNAAQSFPVNQITETTSTQESSSTTSFSIGVFVGADGGVGTATYGQSQESSVSVAIDVPDWQVDPKHDDRSNSPTWSTVQGGGTSPQTLTFATMSSRSQLPNVTANEVSGCGCEAFLPGGLLGASEGAGGTYVPNDLNIAGLSPTVVSTFDNAVVAGPVKVTATKTLSLVDHYTFCCQLMQSYFNLGGDLTQFWGLTAAMQNAFHITPITITGDDPNARTSAVTTSPVGPGVNFCDPAVMAPSMASTCIGKGYPVLTTKQR